MSWIETNKNHWVWKINEDHYRIVIVSWNDEHSLYLLRDGFVTVSELSREEIEDAIDVFYSSLEELKRTASHWKQIVAELYVENQDWILGTEEEQVMDHFLKEKYGFVNGYDL